MGELRALDPPADVSEVGRMLLRYARETIEMRGQDFAGFVLIAWGSDGGTTTSAKIDTQSTIPRALIPAYIAELARRDFVTENEIDRRLDEVGLITKPPSA